MHSVAAPPTPWQSAQGRTIPATYLHICAASSLPQEKRASGKSCWWQRMRLRTARGPAVHALCATSPPSAACISCPPCALSSRTPRFPALSFGAAQRHMAAPNLAPSSPHRHKPAFGAARARATSPPPLLGAAGQRSMFLCARARVRDGRGRRQPTNCYTQRLSCGSLLPTRAVLAPVAGLSARHAAALGLGGRCAHGGRTPGVLAAGAAWGVGRRSCLLHAAGSCSTHGCC